MNTLHSVETCLIFYLCLVSVCKSQLFRPIVQLSVQYSSAKLPQSAFAHSVHYDNQNSIFIFGGILGSSQRQILKYSLASDNVSKNGLLPSTFFDGSVHSDEKGDVFLFGAGIKHNEILKYSIRENKSEIVSTLPWDIQNYPSALDCRSKGDRNTVLIFRQIILSFNLESYQIAESTTKLPQLRGSRAICVVGRVFIFHRDSNNVLELDWDNLKVSPLIKEPDFPSFYTSPTSITDGNSVYIIAAFDPSKSPMISSNEGFLRFDPATNDTSFIHVRNWSATDGEQCAYVEKLKRIYCFGGRSAKSDEIFYMDINMYSANITEGIYVPNEFFCQNRSKGFYPHSRDCSKYIGCRDGEVDNFICPHLSLFNPLVNNCDLPQNVACHWCIGKRNGHYQYPNNPSLYIICEKEIPTIVKCPQPLIFDTKVSHCNYVESESR